MARRDRQELGALLTRLTRRVIEAERPILERHGLSMWGYVALSRIAERPASTQLALAQAMRYDKTRLIGLLDELERAGLVTREADPADRRAKVVRITARGAERHAAVARDIAAMERELLDGVGVGSEEERAFVSVLERLAPPREPDAS